MCGERTLKGIAFTLEHPHFLRKNKALPEFDVDIQKWRQSRNKSRDKEGDDGRRVRMWFSIAMSRAANLTPHICMKFRRSNHPVRKHLKPFRKGGFK
jgi:hypothetical protein